MTCERRPLPTRLVHVIVDAADPAGLARFWSAALGWPVTHEDPGEVEIKPPADDPRQAGQLPQVFVLIDEPRTVKNRVHVDLVTDDREKEIARLLALGATRGDHHDEHGRTWTVMADPESNDFCIAGP